MSDGRRFRGVTFQDATEAIKDGLGRLARPEMTTVPTFTEREPYEKGFARVFVQDIVPRLDELERERRALLEKRRIRIQITIVATVIGAGFSLMLFNEYPSSSHRITAGMWKLFPILVAAGVGSFWVGKLHRAHQESLREIIVPAVCRFFDGLEYTRDPGERFDHKRFFELGVVPAAPHFTEKVRLEDMFIGRHRDTAFRMVDAEFQRKSGRHTTTVFDGLLFEIAVPAEFSGRVLIGEDKGDFGEESRVEFDHPDFKDRYTVYASDADEARRLVCPEFCDTMVALADAFDKKSLGAAFVDGVFLLAVPVPGDLFEPGSITRSVYDCEADIHEYLKELTIAHRVINYFRPLAKVSPRHQALGVPVVVAAGRIGTRRRPSSRTRIDRSFKSLFSILKVAFSWGFKAGLVGLVGGFFGGCLLPAASNMCWFWGIIWAPPAFIVVTWLALLSQVRRALRALTLPKYFFMAYVVIVIFWVVPLVWVWRWLDDFGVWRFLDR